MIEQLLNAARPMKKFWVMIGDTKVEMQARRPGAIEAQKILDSWNDTYEKSRERILKNDQKEDLNLLERSLRRQANDRLAKYIARADRLELLGEAQMLCDDKPVDDPMVQAKLEELILEREKNLAEGETRDTLIEMALERRAHIQAMIEAQVAQMRTAIVQMVYSPDGARAFANEEELGQLPETVIEDIFDKANKVLEEPKDDPLKSAA